MKTQNNKKSSPETSSSQTTIYDLPEEVLLHILHFLPTTTAAQTSAVGPAWRNLWHSLPVLDFDFQDFLDRKPDFSRLYARRRRFAELLSQALSQWLPQFPIHKFMLSFPCQKRDSMWEHVDSWLRPVISAGAVKLYLDFSGFDSYKYLEVEKVNYEDLYIEENLHYPYVLHCSGLVNSSVRVLKLRCCNLCFLASSDKILSLRELHLKDFSYTNEQIAHWLATCVNLERLSLVGVEIKEDLKIESSSLKRLELWGTNDRKRLENSVEISAPNLESIIVYDVYDGKYHLEETPSLVDADVKFPGRNWRDFTCWTNIISSLGGVEWLSTQNMWCRCMFDSSYERRVPNLYKDIAKYQVSEEIFSGAFVFHNLKDVELLTGYSEDDIRGLEVFLEKCPQLETLTLVKEYGHVKVKNASFVLHMPRLRLVEMQKFQNTLSEVFFVRLLKKYGKVLEEIVAYPDNAEGESYVL